MGAKKEAIGKLAKGAWNIVSWPVKKTIGAGAAIGGVVAYDKYGRDHSDDLMPKIQKYLEKFFKWGEGIGAGSIIFGLGLGAAGAFVDPTIAMTLGAVGAVAGQSILNVMTEKTIEAPTTNQPEKPLGNHPRSPEIGAAETIIAPITQTIKDVTNKIGK